MIAPPDADAVTDLLRRHVDRRATCAAITRTSVGNSQETWIVDVAGIDHPRQLVLRRSAAAGTIEWSDRRTEVVALAAARRAGLPVPRVWWWDPDGGSLRRSYLVMDRAAGSPPDLRDDAVRAPLAGEIGRLLARLHDSSTVPAELRPGEPPIADVDRWTARASATGLAPALMMALCGWLRRTAPADDGTRVLLWGDPGSHNVLCDDDGHIAAMLDWELAAAGHPAADLGAARWACLGHLDPEALTASYGRERGEPLDIEMVAWYETLACVSRSVMLLDGVRATLDGRLHDPNVLALGTAMLSANLVRGATIAWGRDVLDAEVSAAQATPLRPTPIERDDAIARFLVTDVLPCIDDQRVRRGVKIAAALLSASVDDRPSAEVAGDHYAAERAGTATDADRRQLVAAMLAARRAQRRLLDLYGPTTAIP